MIKDKIILMCCDFVGASLMMALVLWNDNFGSIMVFFCFFFNVWMWILPSMEQNWKILGIKSDVW